MLMFSASKKRRECIKIERATMYANLFQPGLPSFRLVSATVSGIAETFPIKKGLICGTVQT